MVVQDKTSYWHYKAKDDIGNDVQNPGLFCHEVIDYENEPGNCEEHHYSCNDQKGNEQ